jgi:hypothetical protein
MRTGRLAVIALAILAAPACSKDSIDTKAAEAVERSRSTQDTYSLYLWNRVRAESGEYDEEWSAEFHSGGKHRVETPRDRIVADCNTREATHLHVPSGTINHGSRIANAACGINANDEVSSLEYIGAIESPFGPVDRVRIVDEEFVRVYDVAANGALVSGSYYDKAGEPVIQTVAVAMTDDALPDLFTEQSLRRSAVPDEYRIAPAAQASTRASSPRSGSTDAAD